jgi:hypothetical protein
LSNKKKRHTQSKASLSQTQSSTKKTTTQSPAKPSQSCPAKSRQKEKSQFQQRRVTSRFPINISHAPEGNTDRLWHAFEVAEDGHCLFNAFKYSLQIQDSVSELRRQVVHSIENQPNAMRRLSALNAHIGREQEHGNWLDVEMFDAGTDDNPGALDERFYAVFSRYSDHMLSIAWGGKTLFFI